MAGINASASSSRNKRTRAPASDDEDSATTRKRRQTQRAVDDDEEQEEGENEEDEYYRRMEEQDVEAEGQAYAEQGDSSFKVKYDRGEDGYVAGSVVRIKATNFMTYDHVEFRPGPHLNMILGPNGTGKSSIAASIAIGLGFPPKVMGRANEVRSYVKQGHDEAQLEIELKGRPSQPNTIICRKFNRLNEKSEWLLEGEAATRTRVMEVVQGYGVQANNLCSFLPQDKVAEFAKMDAVTVLKETMRAAGDPRLTKWHETLIAKGKKASALEENLDKHVASRDKSQTQVDSLAPDVEHVRERETREFEVRPPSLLLSLPFPSLLSSLALTCFSQKEVLEHILGIAEHVKLREQSVRAEVVKKKVKEKLEAHERGRQPLRDLQEWLIRKDSQGTRREDIADQINKLKKKVERERLEKESCKTNIGKCEAILAEPREDHEVELRKAKEERVMSQRYREKERDEQELAREYERESNELKDIDQAINRLHQEKSTFESVERRKEDAARQASPSISFLLDYLKDNPDSFEGKVHKPLMISVNVPNRQYAWQVEACTNWPQRQTFICEKKADYDHLISLNGRPLPQKYIKNNGRWNPNRNTGPPKVQLYLALQELTEFGFDGFAIDFVDADPGVIAYLASVCRMHITAVTQKPSERVRTDELPRLGFKQWGTAKDWTRSNQSTYGRKAYSQIITAKTEARSFNIVSTLPSLSLSYIFLLGLTGWGLVDTEAVAKKVDEIAKLRRKKEEAEQPHGALRDKISAVNSQKKEIHAEGVSTVLRLLFYVLTQLFKEKLVRLEGLPSYEAERTKLNNMRIKNARDRLRPLAASTNYCDTVMDNCADLIAATFRQAQVTTNKKMIDDKVKSGSARGMVLRDRYETGEYIIAPQMTQADVWCQASKAWNHAKALTNNKWNEIKARLKPTDRTVREEVTKRAKDPTTLPSVDQVLNDLNTVKNQLEMSVNIPTAVIKQWERRTKELEAAQKIVDEEEEELAELKEDITDTLAKFNPALNTLVTAVSKKFSEAFERVKCRGEVGVDRSAGSDYGKWGIKIMVAYRDSDDLAVLSGSHQSGGERSLATVTYLMSLSEMSRTPFSLVDEINQGMDQRAERAVHNQLVDVTCGSESGQYFLITPKLLNGLEYHPKMKVLIINNGIHLPDPYDLTQRYGALKASLNKYRSTHGITA
ncbi:hypothetical protein I350_06180 [Cryptococcus amylolentus CBS 6273]|uniref:Structural maintenance of chromosomes protein 5 n=1 Tax=Cryptococcus amylolentus CBS 6273 TaxID=1296118 RepID=A0A1E3JKG1_9TREE|nr:hypothetical protein I350_06180 [Cryptococcus amylolentus CBS 6273]